MKIRSLILILPLVLFVAACGGQEDDMQQSDENSETGQEDMAMQQDSETADSQAPENKVNVNTASEEVLLTIPGVGERMAYEFDEYRPYTTILQFRREIGKYVDEEQVTAYEEYIFVPIDPNDSDAATLQQIPGLDESEAGELISARPFDSNDAFLEAVSSYVSEDELATAERYLASE